MVIEIEHRGWERFCTGRAGCDSGIRV